MKLVSIQGARARGFYFHDDDKRMIYRKLRSFLDRRFLFINSPFKTDLLYESDADHNDYIIKFFYSYKGRRIAEKYQRYFFRTATLRESLENYFDRILYLSLNPSWQQLYLAELKSIIVANPNNPVLHKLIECYGHFDVDKYRIHIPAQQGRPSVTVTPDNAKKLVMRLLSGGEEN